MWAFFPVEEADEKIVCECEWWIEVLFGDQLGRFARRGLTARIIFGK